MKRLTILQLVSDLRSAGAQQVVFNLAKGFKERGHKIVIGTFELGDMEAAFKKNDLPVVLFNEASIGRVQALRSLVSFLHRERIDVIHSHLWLANLYGRWATQWCKVPLVITEHGRYAFQKLSRRLVNRWVLSGARRAVAVCEHLRQEFIDTNQVTAEEMLTIYNGLDLFKFSTTNTSSKRQGSNGESIPGIPRIGLIGNLRPIKGHQYFLRAARNVLHNHPKAQFLIIGEGQIQQTLKEQVSQLGIAGSVQFLGRRSDIPELLSTLDVFVLSSLFEGLPMSLLEAMAMRRPVVATSVGGIPEVILPGVNGLLVPPANHEALADKICELIQNPTRARELGISGLDTVRARFSMKKMVNNYEALYNEVL